MARSRRERLAALGLLAGSIGVAAAERLVLAVEATDFCSRLGRVLQRELIRLIRQPAATRLYQRHERYRRLGTSGPDAG